MVTTRDAKDAPFSFVAARIRGDDGRMNAPLIGAGPVGRLRRLRRSELPEDTVDLARFLVGKLLVRDRRGVRTSGRIVETEAYPVGDEAGHAFIGMTARNRSLFLTRGHAYVYFIYGSSYCCNVSSERRGIGGGVLLRALEPLEGVSVMQRRRGTAGLAELAKGPGRLAAAMAIDRRCDGIDLCAAGPLWLGADERRAPRPSRSVRIGLTKEAHRRLRFYERGSAYVSGPRELRR
ncbi:putative 3-methyladenine DNA glycosylase [Hypericibacter adhaerens]|uniref:Putative 3-methyladenine DNA glycosylase n=2 Tax=Hypericibacter adhaerens TaxID=2602016 RepID=A0A5J6N175_9PROT|nr:putative 3-methyladenine DNA glycosylase [Hypericibacter adhaerens]